MDFTVAYELSIVNSYFKKKEEHLVTFKSRNIRTQIDYFLTRVNSRRLCKDCKVIPSEYLTTQHRLLVMDVEFRSAVRRKRSVGVYKIKWWNLIGENVTKLSEKIKIEGTWRLEGDINKIWEGMTECIRRSTREVLRVSRRGKGENEGSLVVE